MIVHAQYEITAHHTGGEYHATGDTVVAVETETVDTYIDLVPSFNISQYNYMERLWAYLSVRSLLKKVERGQLYSCQPQPQPEFSYQVRPVVVVGVIQLKKFDCPTLSLLSLKLCCPRSLAVMSSLQSSKKPH